MGNDLINRFKEFDAKERSNLIRKVFGKVVETVSIEFKGQVIEAINKSPVNTIISEHAVLKFWAMDFHLDWIYACLHGYEENKTYPTYTEAGSEKSKIIYGTQEDIDFLMIFEDGDTVYIVLVEAKLFSSWRNKQLNSKVSRLKKIFENMPEKYKNVKFSLCLLSPKRPVLLTMEGWPDWAEFYAFLEWDGPFSDKKKIVRCNKDNRGERWRVDKR